MVISASWPSHAVQAPVNYCKLRAGTELNPNKHRWVQSRGASWWASLLERTPTTGNRPSDPRKSHVQDTHTADLSAPFPSTSSEGNDITISKPSQPSTSSPSEESRIAEAEIAQAVEKKATQEDGTLRKKSRYQKEHGKVDGKARQNKDEENGSVMTQKGSLEERITIHKQARVAGWTDANTGERNYSKIRVQSREQADLAASVVSTVRVEPKKPTSQEDRTDLVQELNYENLQSRTGKTQGNPEEFTAAATPAAFEAQQIITTKSAPDAGLQVEKELRQLREQVQRLQEALETGHGPKPERQPDARYSRKIAFKTELKMLRSGKKSRTLILAAARSLLVVATSRLRFIMIRLENMSYPGAHLLGAYIRKSVYPEFCANMHAASDKVTIKNADGLWEPWAPRVYYAERYLNYLERLHGAVYANLRATLPQALPSISEPAVEVVAPVRRKKEQSKAAAPSDSSEAAVRPVHTLSHGSDSEKLVVGKTETPSQEVCEQSLLAELFPEATSYVQPHYNPRKDYSKINLPENVPIRRTASKEVKTQRERMIESFQNRGESLVALQLTHCSTELTESDFRRLIPRGKHIESWVRDGEFQKVIPGRDPWTLERLPFYYLIFKSFESALAYQKNASRLHKLAALHQPTSILSAIPPPPGLLEDGEDVSKVLATYVLRPTSLRLGLNMVMQPYNPSLRLLLQRGGYNPIVPSIGDNGQPLSKILLHIEGWEPTQEDLYHIFTRHARDRGLTWPFHNGEKGIHRLREIIDVKTKFQAVSSMNPRSSSSGIENLSLIDFNEVDPMQHSEAGKGELKQILLSRVYNRWILEFEDESAAQRFVRIWHRRILPNPKEATWKDKEEPRMINAELLW